jgi:hypothetical protein
MDARNGARFNELKAAVSGVADQGTAQSAQLLLLTSGSFMLRIESMNSPSSPQAPAQPPAAGTGAASSCYASARASLDGRTEGPAFHQRAGQQMGQQVEVRPAERATEVLALARGHQGDQTDGEGAAEQRGEGYVDAPPCWCC